MNRSLVLIGLALVLGLAVSLVLWLDGAGPSAGEDAGAAAVRHEQPRPTTELPASDSLEGEVQRLRGQALTNGGATPSAAGGLAGADADAQAASEPMALLRGRVLLAGEESLLPDVAVTLHLDPATPLPSEQTTTRTDAQGRYLFAFDQAVRIRGAMVAAGDDAGGSVTWRSLSVPLGGEATLDLHVTRGARVSGQVLDESGAPVAGAQVLLWSRPDYMLDLGGQLQPPDRRFETTPDGRFVVPATGAQFVLSAARPGDVCVQRLGGELGDGEVAEGLTLVLSPAERLPVQVLDGGARPLPDARLTLTPPRLIGPSSMTAVTGVYGLAARRQQATSDAEGRVVFEAVAPRELAVRATLSGRRDEQLQHDPREGQLTVVMSRGAALEGLVLAADGNPAAGATVRVRGAGSQSVTCGADGRFLAEGLSAAPDGRLCVTAPGHALQVLQPVEVSADVTRFVQLRLEPERLLAGRVVDGAGQPLAGAALSLEGDRLVDHGNVSIFPVPTWEGAVGRDRAVSDVEGRFVFPELYAGEFKLKATHPSQPDVTGTWQVPSGSEALELVLDPEARAGVVLSGWVRDAHTGQAVPQFRLTPMRPMGEAGAMAGSNRSFSDPAGRFLWSGLEPGEFQLNASAEGYGPWSRPLQVYDEGEHELEILLRAQRDLALRCVDEAGAPLFDVTLRFEDEDGRDLMVAMGVGSRSSMLSTDQRGEATARELPAGRVSVLAQAPGVARDDAHRAVFDLWNELPGVQVLVLPDVQTEPAGRRMALNLAWGIEDPGLPVFGASPDDRQRVLHLAQAGKLAPLDGPVQARYTSRDGDLRPLVRAGPDAEGRWSLLEGEGAGEVHAGAAGRLVLSISPDGGLVTLQPEGAVARLIDVPAGDDDLDGFVVFLRE